LRAASTSADTRWLRTVLQSGTAGDRLAAMTLLVQESPLHALRHLGARARPVLSQEPRQNLCTVRRPAHREECTRR
jgi:ribosome biogenesis protein MAK21